MELAQRQKKDQPVNLRLSRTQRDLIDQAAHVSGRSRTEFMVDAAYREAEDVLLDRVVYPVDSDTFDEFQQLLDNPVAPTDILRKTLRQPSPWED